MGCRFPVGGGSIEKGAMPLLNRYVGNPILSKIGKLFFKVSVNDFHCGLRGMKRDIFNRMELMSTGMEFASEIIIKARLLDLKIAEVPITLHCSDRSRQPHLRPWRDGWRHLKLLFLYCPKWLFLYPGISLFGFGFIGIILLTFMDKIEIGHVILYINSMLVFCLVFMTGAQLVFFSVIANTLAFISGLAVQEIAAGQFGKRPSLRRISILGLITFLIGLTCLVHITVIWAQMGFTFSLNEYPVAIKSMILAVTLTILGIQLIFLRFIVDMIELVKAGGNNRDGFCRDADQLNGKNQDCRMP